MIDLKRSELVVAVAQRITSARKAAGLTQDQVAERLRIAKRNLQRIEAGQQNLTLETIEKIARALGTPTHHILCETYDATGFPATFISIHDRPDLKGTVPVPIPVIELTDATEALRDPRTVAALGWALLQKAPATWSFIARVDAKTMEPLIPAGSYNLFGPAPPDIREDATLLFQMSSRQGEGVPESPFVRKVGPRRTDDDANLATFALVATSPAHRPLLLQADKVHVVAEWLSVVKL